MTENKLKQDNHKGFEGIAYQFYCTIDACYALGENERLYVETYGDIAISKKSNIEVKARTANLIDASPEIWNTLKNWLDPQFKISEYKKHILITTQKFSSKTEWRCWNNKTLEEKKDCLNKIHKKFKDKDTKTAQLINGVMAHEQSDRFGQILEQFTIDNDAPSAKAKKTEIINLYLKGIPNENVDDFLNNLMGYILERSYTRGNKTNNGEISEKDFTSEIQKLTTHFCAGIRPFPTKYRDQEEPNALSESYLFIQKIKEIPYNEKITGAYKDYMYAVKTCNDDFREGFSTNNFREFEKETIKTFKNRHERCCLTCSDVTKESKTFYLDRTEEVPLNLSGYETPNKDFRNGVIHMNLDDQNNNLKWRLEKSE